MFSTAFSGKLRETRATRFSGVSVVGELGALSGFLREDSEHFPPFECEQSVGSAVYGERGARRFIGWFENDKCFSP